MKILQVFSLIFVLMLSVSSAKDLKKGDKAPDFTLQDSNGKTYTLSEFEGKSPVIVYFYPKANTPGCTKEACGIRDEFAKFSENNIQVFGVSVDSKEDIKKFVGDYSLNFPLLSDSTKETTEKYGVLGKSGMANRVTFIVDKNGKIAAILKDFDINSHASDVLEIAKKL